MKLYNFDPSPNPLKIIVTQTLGKTRFDFVTFLARPAIADIRSKRRIGQKGLRAALRRCGTQILAWQMLAPATRCPQSAQSDRCEVRLVVVAAHAQTAPLLPGT